MIDSDTLDKIIPLPDEDTAMEQIQNQLIDEGFVITNFYKGSVFYFLTRLSVTIGLKIKELARTIINAGYMRHAEEEWLEIKAADYSINRKAATKAQGYITIYRYDTTQNLLITKGHCFKTLPDAHGIELKYYVVSDTVIKEGVPVGRVLVEADMAGTIYNVLPDKITKTLIHLEGVDRVSNVDDWITQAGAEIETLESLRERCLSSYAELATRTTEQKLINAAQSVVGVLYARIDAQHPRGQGTVDIIITSTTGTASDALLCKVAATIEPLRGNYEDYLVISSEVVKQPINITIYLDTMASIEGVKETAEKLITNMMALSRGRLNTLYRDSIIKVLSSNITGYIKTDILAPDKDLIMSKDTVIVLSDVSIIVKNIDGE